MARLSLCLFGSYQITLEGKVFSQQIAAKGRALLAYLAVEVQAQRREKIAGLLWPNQNDTQARQNLSQAVHSLRGLFMPVNDEPPLFIISGQEIKLNPDAKVWVDVAEFLALLEACERHPHPQQANCEACFERLQQAVVLYRGDFLADFSLKDNQPFEEWSTLLRERFHRRALRLMHQLAECLEQRGEIEPALEYAWRQVELEPLREASHRQVMHLLAASGRRSEALAQFSALQHLLQDSLGVTPDGETLALYEHILAQVHRSAVLPAGEVRLPAALTPFIVRQDELRELAALLDDPACRLVTLFGPGGVGKTRLALEATHHLAPNFPAGVYFISLSAYQPGSPLWPLLVEALRIPLRAQQDPDQQVFDYLHEKHALLLFDSFETALEQAAWLSDLLRGAPHLFALVTSRAWRSAPSRSSLWAVWIYQHLARPSSPSNLVQSSSSRPLSATASPHSHWMITPERA
jgi:DNA-binding SARP family transcriptional activator